MAKTVAELREEQDLAVAFWGAVRPRPAEIRPAFAPFKHPTEGHAMLNGAWYSGRGLAVKCSVNVIDEQAWLHVSFSRRSRLPDYKDLRLVKRRFVGDDRVAVEVHPTQAQHVNLHPFTRHLWSCLDASPLPDFARYV